jgi:PadR family transcriptional regulator, regulatory protein PadR
MARSIEEPNGCLPRNFLRSCLLLQLHEGPAHGYGLNEDLRAFGLHHHDPGGVYRTLRSMEQEGLVSSYWQTSHSGPARRTYSITEEGELWLEGWERAMRDSLAFLNSFLDRYAAAKHPSRIVVR